MIFFFLTQGLLPINPSSLKHATTSINQCLLALLVSNLKSEELNEGVSEFEQRFDWSALKNIYRYGQVSENNIDIENTDCIGIHSL